MDLGDHPNPAMCDHLKSGQGREGIGGRTGRQNKVVEKTAAEAALEIALRFPLSHNLCCWYHLTVRDIAGGRSSDACEDTTQEHEAEPPRQHQFIWPDFG